MWVWLSFLILWFFVKNNSSFIVVLSSVEFISFKKILGLDLKENKSIWMLLILIFGEKYAIYMN